MMRRLKSLQHIVITVMKILPEVSNFLVLLLLFIYIFSLLGMQVRWPNLGVRNVVGRKVVAQKVGGPKVGAPKVGGPNVGGPKVGGAPKVGGPKALPACVLSGLSSMASLVASADWGSARR
jgi:hypothetical protein